MKCNKLKQLLLLPPTKAQLYYINNLETEITQIRKGIRDHGGFYKPIIYIFSRKKKYKDPHKKEVCVPNSTKNFTSSTSTLNATIPPKALTGSASTASLYASIKSFWLATPQTFVCFTITQVGWVYSETQFQTTSVLRAWP